MDLNTLIRLTKYVKAEELLNDVEHLVLLDLFLLNLLPATTEEEKEVYVCLSNDISEALGKYPEYAPSKHKLLRNKLRVDQLTESSQPVFIEMKRAMHKELCVGYYALTQLVTQLRLSQDS